MALIKVKLNLAQLVHGRMLPANEPVDVPQSFADDFVKRGLGVLVTKTPEPPPMPAGLGPKPPEKPKVKGKP